MRPQDLFDLLRKRPFVPFRIYATDGRTLRCPPSGSGPGLEVARDPPVAVVLR